MSETLVDQHKAQRPQEGSVMTASRSVTVLVVDDHPMFRLGVAHLLQPNPEIRVIEATCQSEASVMLREHSVDLAIVDISLPDGSGLELIRNQRTQHKNTRWLVFSVYNESYYLSRARRAGAHGFIGKSAVQGELMEAVTTLLNGGEFPFGFETRADNSESEFESLSEREMTIFRLIGEGLSVEKIANSLSRSRKTVNAIRDRIRAKLGIRSSAELSRFATQWYLSQEHSGPPAPMGNKRKPGTRVDSETGDQPENRTDGLEGDEPVS